MNFGHMPELNWVLGYPFALALMLTAAGVAVAWFRSRNWF
jgi:magnesium transporter